MLALLLGYGSVVGTMWYKQREHLFNFQHRGVAFESLDLANTKLQWLETPDAVKLETFYNPPRKGRPIVLFFHGKGTSLANEDANSADVRRTGFWLSWRILSRCRKQHGRIDGSGIGDGCADSL